ncbi:MAG: wax ester/triacylglycerol synthase family O-acyltransferase [Halomonadaceae bacterium]|nr:MAG: wax ester/triacylglycerol synthase family O-acyltransferase [Halomonadaceae bacterium]
MRQLSELDASFLYLESETTPMHIGGLYLFDGSAQNTPISFSAFRHFLEKRLHLAHFFRQRIMPVPLRLDRPYWVDDADFDLDNHLDHQSLKNQGGMDELTGLTADVLAQMLNGQRPLWHVTFVDELGPELPENSFAIIVRVHHAAIDAFSGEEVMGTLLEYTSKPQSSVQARPWSPRQAPSPVRLAAQASANVIQRPFKLAGIARDAAGAALHGLVTQQLGRLHWPSHLFKAPKTPFNRNITARRQLVSHRVPLARLKALKAVIGEGVTLNDVVLGVCAETLNRYLEQQQSLPVKSLIALTPVSVRSKSLRRPTGNQMSAMLLSLASDEPNPALRVRLINRNARVSEIYQQAIAADRLTELVPSTMLALSARLYSEFQLAQRYQPMFNVPITNVPGPQVPLFLQGARLIRQINSAPLFDGAGMVILAVSYQGEMNFNFTLCPDLVADADKLPALIEDSLKAIEEAAYHPVTDQEIRQDNAGSALLDDVIGKMDGWLERILKPTRRNH